MKTRLLPVVVLAVIVAACTGSVATTTTPTTVPPSGITTEPDICPETRCVRLRIDPDARWSDGEPVTADDFVHTLDMARAASSADPAYRAVSRIDVIADDEVLIALSDVSAPFQRLFEVVLPAHDDRVTSGPLDHDLRGEGFDLETVDVDGVRGVIQAFRRGEADLGWLPDPPGWAIEELEALEDVNVTLVPGPDWEMITFNQQSPLLAEAWLRQAVALAIDRETLADLTVRTVDPPASLLDTTMWVDRPGMGDPYPHAHDPDAAVRALLDNGCVREGDGPFVCDDHPLRFTWMTTAGDVWRETMVERMASDLADLGIEVDVRLMYPADIYRRVNLAGDGWDIVSFAWTAQVDPTAAAELYRCDGGLNFARHCPDGVDETLATAMGTIDDDERRLLLEEVDRAFVDPAAIIPLFARPVAWVFKGEGADPSPFDGPFDVAARLGRDVRLALVDQPGDPATLGALDPVESSLRRAHYRGAFRALPGGGYAPDLVVDFEVID